MRSDGEGTWRVLRLHENLILNEGEKGYGGLEWKFPR